MPKDAEIHKLCAKADYDGVEALFRPSSTQIDVNIPGSGGRTPLHRAIGANANDIVKSLIEKHNADVNKTLTSILVRDRYDINIGSSTVFFGE